MNLVFVHLLTVSTLSCTYNRNLMAVFHLYFGYKMVFITF